MIKVREISKIVQIKKVATISLTDLISFVTGGGYAASMKVEVDYEDNDDREEDYGYIHYYYNNLKGNMPIFNVIDNYIIRYAEGRGFFQIEYIDYDENSQEFNVTYISG